jgi:hypothetical protein
VQGGSATQNILHDRIPQGITGFVVTTILHGRGASKRVVMRIQGPYLVTATVELQPGYHTRSGKSIQPEERFFDRPRFLIQPSFRGRYAARQLSKTRSAFPT